MADRTISDDMRETAQEALNALREKDEPEETEEPEEVEDKEGDDEPEEPEGSPEEGDDEPEEEAPEEEPEEAVESADDDDAPEEDVSEEPEDPEIINPPTTWRPAAKAKWNTADPDLRREVIKRERDIANGITQYKEKAEFGERLDRTILPYQPILQQRGLSPEQAIGESLQFIHAMTTETPERKGLILQRLAQMYGANLEVTQDESAMKFQQQLQPLYQELNQLRQNSQQQKTQQEQQLQQEVQSFAQATNDDGTLAHPYFDNVRGLMASLIESGQASGLEDAYTIAIKAHPDTSQLIESEQAAKKEAKRQAEAKKRAEKAKKNEDINVKKKGQHSEQPTKPPGTIRDTASEVLAEIRQRAS